MGEIITIQDKIANGSIRIGDIDTKYLSAGHRKPKGYLDMSYRELVSQIRTYKALYQDEFLKELSKTEGTWFRSLLLTKKALDDFIEGLKIGEPK